jgi:hypothetical protein
MTGAELRVWRERKLLTVEEAAMKHAIAKALWRRWESLPERVIPKRVAEGIKRVDDLAIAPKGPGLKAHSTP